MKEADPFEKGLADGEATASAAGGASRRVAVAQAIGYTGIEVLSNDKRALSLQRVPSLMAYLGMVGAE